jgi:uncharacterized protein YfdQ (DUF2303 family)
MCVIKRRCVERSYRSKQNLHMFRRLRLSRNPSHKELPTKGHEKRLTMGIDEKNVLLVRVTRRSG